MENEIKLVVKVVGAITLFILLLVTLFGTFGNIDAGHRGVLLTFGAVSDDIKPEGLYTKVPFVQSVKEIDIRIQKEQVEASAASKDLQTVHSLVAVNYRLSSERVNLVWQQVGKDYKITIIDPAIQEVFKANTAKHSAEELIKNRESIREAIKGDLKERLLPYYIIVEEFNIVNFDFSPSFNAAIEAKQVAEQQALMASRILDRITIEKEQQIKAAEGKAQAIKIEAEALKTNPQVAEIRWIEKWNGQVPQYWGFASPFVGLPTK